jgi:hypothetical protein
LLLCWQAEAVPAAPHSITSPATAIFRRELKSCPLW